MKKLREITGTILFAIGMSILAYSLVATEGYNHTHVGKITIYDGALLPMAMMFMLGSVGCLWSELKDGGKG